LEAENHSGECQWKRHGNEYHLRYLNTGLCLLYSLSASSSDIPLLALSI
jgi:hypothetical protein